MMTQNSFNGRNFCLGVVLVLFATQLACRSIGSTPNRPLLAVTVVPAAAPGGDEQLDVIKGTATGAGPHDRIVIYTFSKVWYVQPWVNAPYTSIDAEGNWSSTIHLGAEYAALLVTDSYQPPARLDSLPD
ncbi:MAG TPA: hypothetical protein VJ302_07155, partial [Blastocatellia bacterium]|nr:hypothetical protein [Blastocatellia bacterium]